MSSPLVALLGTLIIQGVGIFLARYDTVQRVVRDAGQAGLQQHWFASSIEGMVPYHQAAIQFKGDATSFSGITTQPLGAESGMPVTVRWSILRNGQSSVLTYSEEPAPTNGGGMDWAVPDRRRAVVVPVRGRGWGLGTMGGRRVVSASTFRA